MKYNYFFCEEPITKAEFEKHVPSNWMDKVINFEYSYGYFRAISN